jgi:hypothetical protein
MKKHMALSASLAAAAALLFVTPVLSQAQGTKPRPAAATPEKPESSEPPAATRKRSRRHVDARECLKYPTNMEIHRCALKYL